MEYISLAQLKLVKETAEEMLEDEPDWSAEKVFFVALEFMYPSVADRIKDTKFNPTTKGVELSTCINEILKN